MDLTLEDVTMDDEFTVTTKEDKPQVAGISYRGVEYHVWHPDDSSLWRCHSSHGALPKNLQGMWTGRAKAIEAVKNHLRTETIPNTTKNREAGLLDSGDGVGASPKKVSKKPKAA